MFENTFCIGERSIRDWVLNCPLDLPSQHQNENSNPNKNELGQEQVNIETTNAEEKGQGKGNDKLTPDKMDDGKRASVRQFLDSLPKMESHYCRASTSLQYLEPMWESKAQLYREYRDCSENNNAAVASWSLLYKVFKQQRKERSRKEKEDDKKKAIQNTGFVAFVVDVQKVFTCLDSLPKMESHYCRASTSLQYLEPMWESKAQLYREYRDCSENNNAAVASWSLLYKVFKKNLLKTLVRAENEGHQEYLKLILKEVMNRQTRLKMLRETRRRTKQQPVNVIKKKVRQQPVNVIKKKKVRKNVLKILVRAENEGHQEYLKLLLYEVINKQTRLKRLREQEEGLNSSQ
ncbi:hypothetical protein J6590_084877 [Homalodisca vitripennis]|nr:hypothetical protein J6590_084877 [Homalodisca vitripennis]